MITYAIYTFILFGTTISAYISQVALKYNTRLVFYFFSFFIPFIFLAIRYEINYDYHNYVYYFYQILDGNIPHKEPIYILINLIIGYLGLDVQWLFVTFAFFTIYFAYKAMDKEIFPIAVYLFITLFYLYDGMDIIRQGLVLSIMAYATKYIVQKRFFTYLLFALFSMGIHFFSGLILLMAYPILRIDFNRYFIIFFIVVLYILVLKFGIIEKLMNMFALLFPDYAWYITNERFTQHKTIGTGIGILFKMSILFMVVWFKNKISLHFKRANVFINMYVIYLALMIFSVKIVIFERVQNMFIFGVIFSLAYFLLILEKKSKILLIILIFSFYGMDYYKYIHSKTLKNMKSGKNLAVVNPYRTILDRDKIRVDTPRRGWK